jgi:molecular chaperone GrpE
VTAKAVKDAKMAEAENRAAEFEIRAADAEKKASDNLELAMRIQADFENYKKRAQRENDDFRRYAAESMISELLNVIDDLERALSHAPENNDLTVGVNAAFRNLMKTMTSKGLTEISTDGKFDASVHEALCAEPGDDDGNITEVFQKGYRMGDRVLRYAKVKVTRKQTEEGEQKCQES